MCRLILFELPTLIEEPKMKNIISKRAEAEGRLLCVFGEKKRESVACNFDLLQGKNDTYHSDIFYIVYKRNKLYIL